MKILRTPDARFADLPGYPFAPRYVEVDGLRLHYVDEGARGARTILCLHGEPSWSYLYRKMIPVFVAAGYRAVAPDLVGFGRSDKLASRDEYTYERHVDWMKAWLVAVDLREIVLVCQDWGGLIGLRLVAEMPERFAAVCAANTFLPTGDQPAGEAFLAWRKFLRHGRQASVPQGHGSPAASRSARRKRRSCRFSRRSATAIRSRAVPTRCSAR